MKTFANKVALVTGATSGIGRATALAFAREGARVVVSGRREKEGKETVALLRDAGGEATFVQTAELGNDSQQQIRALHPMNRTGQPEEIAAAVLWLCSNEASFVTGQSLAANGGWTAK